MKQSELIKDMTDKEVLFHLYLTQLVLVAIALVLAVFLFEDFSQFQSIWEPEYIEIFVWGGLTGMAVITIDLFLMKILPKKYFDDGGINEKVFERRSILHIFVLCWIIAIVEEVLFRGVIQTSFGLIFASFLFALTHIRYLKKWLLLVIVTALSFLLGWIYDLTNNLYTTIFAHFLIDFVFGVKIRIEYLKRKKG